MGPKKVLALFLSKMPYSKFPEGYDMPLGWLSHHGANGKGATWMYVDKLNSAPLWKELYDPSAKLWKIGSLFLHTVDVPNVGLIDTSGSLLCEFSDIQNNHASIVADPTDKSHPFYVNDQVLKDYLDVTRYSAPSGLNMIMR
jgi:uncharacterized protein YbdZ (MbtH family)